MFRHILVLETPTDALAELRATLSAVVDPSAVSYTHLTLPTIYSV